MAGVAVRFVVYLGLAQAAVILLSRGTSAVAALCVGTAKTAGWAISVSGIAAQQTGNLIRLPARTLFISSDCTGLFVATLLVSLLLAYPLRIGLRLGGAAVGVAVVAVANIVRLVAVAHMSAAVPGAFDLAHDFLFQVGMVLVAAAYWAAWLAFARRSAS